jgi:GT2 family glycosyltransferase
VWAARHAPTARDLARMRDESARLGYQPLVSLITPVYNTDPRWLRACLESVRRQAYPRWELCICDDASTAPETRAVLDACTDPQIKIVRLDRNSHISAASNAALSLAAGELVGLLDHDDELTPDALFEVVSQFNRAPDTDIVYSDEDKLDADGGLSDPYFKPDWSPDHLLSAMYTCHFTVVRRAIVERAGGFRVGYEGSQDHDLILRMSELTDRIHHLPKVLYHWRRTPESVANTGTEKSWATDAGMRALEDTMRRRRIDAAVMSGGLPGLYRVRFAIEGSPQVSVIVVNTGASREARGAAVERFHRATDYAPLEVIEARGGGRPTTADVHLAVRASRGTHLLFVDASLTPRGRDWVSALLEFSQQPSIGAVGGKLHYADGRLRHVGLLLGVGRGIARGMHGESEGSYGYFSGAIAVRNYSAVSGECLMTRRDVFESVGGFDDGLPWSVADIDYCLKVRRAGLRVVFTPYAQLKIESGSSTSEPDAADVDRLRSRWRAAFDRDPYYNPNLDRHSAYQLS